MRKRMLRKLLAGILAISIVMGSGDYLVFASDIQGKISDEDIADGVEEDLQDNFAEDSMQSILPEESEEESQAEQLPSEEIDEEEVLQEDSEEDLETASSVSEEEIAAWEEKQMSQGFLDLGPDHLDAQNGVSAASEGIENAGTGSASFSKITNLLVLVRFQDQTDDYMNAQNSARLDATYNSTSMQGSMKDYVEAMSYGELTVDTAIFPRSESTMYCSVQVEHTIDYYLTYSETPVITDNTERGYMTSDERFKRERALCDEILRKVKAEIEAELTEAQLDENEDGYIDSISFAFDTIAADARGRIQYADLLWPHKTSYASPVTIHGLYMSSYNFLSRGTDNVGMMGSTRQITSTAVHEFMHTLGLPDLYHYTKSGSPVGGWDVMASTARPTPQLLNAYYQREYMQWGDPLETISSSQNITLTAPDFSDGSERYAVKLVSPYNTKEFFVAEFRSLEGYDRVLPVADSGYTPGLLVYRIVEEDAANNVYVRQGNRTGDDAMYVFRPSETGINACKGSIADAALNGEKAGWNTIGKEAGTEGNGFDANILSFYNGDNSGIVIKNVVQNGDTISFDVEIPTLQGSGTMQDPYQITSPADLRMLNDSEGKYFRLMNDLDLQNYEHNAVSLFQGTFDGNGKIIRNLSVTTNEDAGLFLSIGEKGTVKNLIFESVKITGEGSVGAVAGTVSGIIQNVEVRSGAVICTSGMQKIVGGIVGYVDASGKVTDCVSYASVTGEEVGGIAGRICDGYIADCYVAGTVNGTGTAPKTGGVFGIYYVSDSYKQPVNLYWDVEGTGQNIVGNGDNSFNDGTEQYPSECGLGLQIMLPDDVTVSNTFGKAILNEKMNQGELSCKWSSTNSKILNVQADGTYRAVMAGTAEVICDFKVGSHSCSIRKAITVKKPEIEVRITYMNHKEGTFHVEVLGIEKGSNIQIAVCSNKDTSNIAYYKGYLQTSGMYAAAVNISNHGYRYGLYDVHIYKEDDTGKWEYLKSATTELEKPRIVTTALENGNQSLYMLTAENVFYAGEAKSVRFLVWGDVNGQNDSKFYQAFRTDSGKWQAEIPLLGHKELGIYYIHTYVTLKDGTEKILSTGKFVTDTPTADKIDITYMDVNSGSFHAELKGLEAKAGIQKVTFAACSRGDTSNVNYYTASLQKNESYASAIFISRHQYRYGMYDIHAYVTDNNGVQTYLCSTVVNIPKPNTKISADCNESEMKYVLTGQNVYCGGEAKNVRFLVWGEENGQNDMRFYTATKTASGTWRVDVPALYLKETGKYHIHIYVTAQDGSMQIPAIGSFDVNVPEAELLDITYMDSENGTFHAELWGVTASRGIQEVIIAVCSNRDTSNINYYTASLQENGCYAAAISIARHQYRYGSYDVHAYVKDGSGNVIHVKSRTINIIKPDYKVNAVSDLSQTKFTVRGENIFCGGNVNRVQFLVWGGENGQNDKCFYEAVQIGNGVWKTEVPIVNHKEIGTYYIHLYATLSDGSVQILRTGSFSVSGASAERIDASYMDPKAGTFHAEIWGVKAPSGISSVQITAWCREDASTKYSYDAELQKNDCYAALIALKNHKNLSGIYVLEAYVTDNNGCKTKVLSQEVTALKDWQPQIVEKEIYISGLEKSYNFLYIADTHVVTEAPGDEQRIRELAVSRKAIFLNMDGMSSEEQFPYWIQQANEMDVDGILMGGDIIDFPSGSNMKFLLDNLKNLNTGIDYMYVLGNHDWSYPWISMSSEEAQNFRGLFRPFMKQGSVYVQSMEYENFIILGIDNSNNQVSEDELLAVKTASEKGKPIVIVMHVPLAVGDLAEKAAEFWGSPIVIGDGAIEPSDVTKEFIELLTAEGSPVVALLDGHLHFSHTGEWSNGVSQYVADGGYKGRGMLLKLRGD